MDPHPLFLSPKPHPTLRHTPTRVVLRDMTTMYEPGQLGNAKLKNRIVMAPLTRTRAELDGTPNDLLVEHYRQRAGFGLIIAEGTLKVARGTTSLVLRLNSTRMAGNRSPVPSMKQAAPSSSRSCTAAASLTRR